MPRLTPDIQAFIVQRLACFDTPTAVAEAVKATHGVTVDRRQVETYSPERAGQKPAAKWCKLFEATRAKFVQDTAHIAIAHRSYRLQELDDMARLAKRKGNYTLAAQLLEQAAKEMGESYTNRRVLEPADPVAALAATLGVTPEEITGALAEQEMPPSDAGRNLDRRRW